MPDPVESFPDIIEHLRDAALAAEYVASTLAKEMPDLVGEIAVIRTIGEAVSSSADALMERLDDIPEEVRRAAYSDRVDRFSVRSGSKVEVSP